ncbi:MAG: hypothetical protein QGH06_01510 [Lutibacter sp.]|jgi:hypothetical protein|nr:hypothetical protein [Lutibacter sp.]
MHKKLAAELVSLAHSLLQMKNKEDVFALHEKSQVIFEKLSVLKFVEEYVSTTPGLSETKEEILAGIADKIVPGSKTPVPAVSPEDNTGENPEETPTEMVSPTTDTPSPAGTQADLTAELENAHAAVMAADLFEQIPQAVPENEQAPVGISSETAPLSKQHIKVGLNDRIAFVKQLFDGSQEDFNRVLSQLNSFDTLKEAKTFLNKFVKPDYDWKDKQVYVERFTELIALKFS